MEQPKTQRRGFPTPQPAGGEPPMRLTITSTTGCPVELSVQRGETAEGLRKLISQKLGLQTDRIIVVHKDSHLTAGTLMEQGVTDGSRLTLVPVIETGSVVSFNFSIKFGMKILKISFSLIILQIEDFLLGRLPLTLSLGAGAHTMYVQLQLSQEVRELQGNMDSVVQTRCKPQIAQANNGDLLEASSAGSSLGFTSSQTSSPPLPSARSASSLQCSTQKPRTSFISSTSVAREHCIDPPLVRHSQSDCKPALPLDSTHPPNLPPAATPGDVPAHKPQPPGAVIDSVVNHSPGVFSGTFSGTLAPCGHGGITHPRRGIAIILQILNDLLRAACHHQGALLPPLCNECTASNLPGSHLTAEDPCMGRNRQTPTQSTARGDASQTLHSSEENKTMHCKMERLQLLMHQRRRHRRIRRCSLLHGFAQPNQHRLHRS
uniref:Midnolin n=1 Tax=Xiphophorus couchianus TaxID=32473 RepID=A0A3B5LFK0_9TELE